MEKPEEVVVSVYEPKEEAKKNRLNRWLSAIEVEEGEAKEARALKRWQLALNQ